MTELYRYKNSKERYEETLRSHLKLDFLFSSD